MSPTERIFNGESQAEANQQLPWSQAREATFQSPDDPALIITPAKRAILARILGIDQTEETNG